MKNPIISAGYDPGTGSRYAGRTKRVVNRDGTYNVTHVGVRFTPRDLYQWLVDMKWIKFFLFSLIFFAFINLLFATFYYLIGVEHLRGYTPRGNYEDFLFAFFFSVQTFTTVGYGGMAPDSIGMNIVSSFEAATGLMAFAIITGLLYGKFSKPTSRLLFSDQALMAPYGGGVSLQMRLVNQRRSSLNDVEATLLLVLTREHNGEFIRDYKPLRLEREKLVIFPLTWTLVHPIDDQSPFWNLTQDDLQRGDAEVIAFVKGHDETFNQMIHSRYSYKYDEIVWGAKFVKAFRIDGDGDIKIWVNEIHRYEKAELPEGIQA